MQMYVSVMLPAQRLDMCLLPPFDFVPSVPMPRRDFSVSLCGGRNVSGLLVACSASTTGFWGYRLPTFGF